MPRSSRHCRTCAKKMRSDSKHDNCWACSRKGPRGGEVLTVPLGLRQLLAEFHDDMDREKERGASVRG